MRLVDRQLGDSSPHYLFLFFSSHHIPAHCSLICLSTTETAVLEAKCLIVNSFFTCSSSTFEHLLMQNTMLGKGYILLNNDDDNDSNYDNTDVN